jgi:hypothetical protein
MHVSVVVLLLVFEARKVGGPPVVQWARREGRSQQGEGRTTGVAVRPRASLQQPGIACSACGLPSPARDVGGLLLALRAAAASLRPRLLLPPLSRRVLLA